MEICNRISSECKERNIDLSGDDIFKIAGLFFRHMVSNMKMGNYITISELGEFGMDPKVKKKREHDEEIVAAKNRYLKMKMHTIHWHNKQLLKKWREFNEMRESKGLAPWKFEEWCSVNKLYKKRRIRKDSRLRSK